MFQCFFDPRVLDWSAKLAKMNDKKVKTSYEDDSMPDLKDDGAVSELDASSFMVS